MTLQATAGSSKPSTVFVCPFCGLLCDDLPVPGETVDLSAWLSTVQALCPKAATGLSSVLDQEPQHASSIDGRNAAMGEAIAEAAHRIVAARRPVIGGLGGDVQAMRAALALGDRIGARLLHRNQFVVQRNLFAQQSRGAMTTTLAEVRQRAEMVVLVGGDATRAFPRLLERVFSPNPVFAEVGTRRLVLFGAPEPDGLPAGVGVQRVSCDGYDLFDSVALLRAGVRGLPHTEAADLDQLALSMKECRYGVVIWAASGLPPTGADLLIEQLHQLVIDLNLQTRWAALPLGGNEGDLTANAVSTWQTGFALPIEFAERRVRYDPFPDYGDTDLVIWIGALPSVGVPAVPSAGLDVTQIVLGARPVASALSGRHVVVPTATPGVTASGHLVRTDGVITLYAPAVLGSNLPSAADVLGALARAIDGVAT
jgi:formylmethanofuran dehydrogenase subunit B